VLSGNETAARRQSGARSYASRLKIRSFLKFALQQSLLCCLGHWCTFLSKFPTVHPLALLGLHVALQANSVGIFTHLFMALQLSVCVCMCVCHNTHPGQNDLWGKGSDYPACRRNRHIARTREGTTKRHTTNLQTKARRANRRDSTRGQATALGRFNPSGGRRPETHSNRTAREPSKEVSCSDHKHGECMAHQHGPTSLVQAEWRGVQLQRCGNAARSRPRTAANTTWEMEGGICGTHDRAGHGAEVSIAGSRQDIGRST